MAYSVELEKRIDACLGEQGLAKQKMFGGICYLLQGNMCFGIYKEFLIVRLGSAEAAAPFLAQADVRPMDITGRPMKGWIMVAPSGYEGPDRLTAWIDRGREFVRTLPPK
jgi:hypothetical protein